MLLVNAVHALEFPSAILQEQLAAHNCNALLLLDKSRTKANKILFTFKKELTLSSL